MTQKRLSNLSGINQATLSHMERGLQFPTEKQKIQIAKALQLREEHISWDIKNEC